MIKFLYFLEIYNLFICNHFFFQLGLLVLFWQLFYELRMIYWPNSSVFCFIHTLAYFVSTHSPPVLRMAASTQWVESQVVAQRH